MFFVVYWINDDESENFLIKLKICRKQKKMLYDLTVT